MLPVFLLVALGGVGLYNFQKPRATPELQYRPGTPNDIVEICRQAAISAAREHAAEMGAEVQRVDAASAGVMQRAGGRSIAPVEVGVVYSLPIGWEVRKGVVECRVVRRQGAVLTSLPGRL